jgi:hypothetical protein
MPGRFDVYETIALIRPRPAMYIGEHSLPCLCSFLYGCLYLAYQQAIETNEHPEFQGFHDWIAARFGWSESTSGWCNIIIQECGGDQRKAMDRFFDLVEEYQRTG